MILRKIKNEIEIDYQIKISKAVVTVPSMFNACQRFAVNNAVLSAGIEVQAILNHSTACAFDYFFMDKKEDKNILIFDMEASSTDVAVVRVRENSVEMRACGGNINRSTWKL